jgi:hypothetical protein
MVDVNSRYEEATSSPLLEEENGIAQLEHFSITQHVQNIFECFSFLSVVLPIEKSILNSS